MSQCAGNPLEAIPVLCPSILKHRFKNHFTSTIILIAEQSPSTFQFPRPLSKHTRRLMKEFIKISAALKPPYVSKLLPLGIDTYWENFLPTPQHKESFFNYLEHFKNNLNHTFQNEKDCVCPGEVFFPLRKRKKKAQKFFPLK